MLLEDLQNPFQTKVGDAGFEFPERSLIGSSCKPERYGLPSEHLSL